MLRILLILSLLLTNSWALAHPPSLKFASAEHVLLGDSVNLRFTPEDPIINTPLLTLPNGLSLSYGQIVSLGDFYGIPNAPISLGATITEQRIRFMQAFESFANSSANTNELNQILTLIQTEINYIRQGLEHGISEEELYQHAGSDFQRQANCITGGGCMRFNWWLYPGRYLALAKNNRDHFAEGAISNYQTGHQIALEMALQASKTQNKSDLELAYAVNAFACHFLSDRYASGHLRVPRTQLPEYVSPDLIAQLLTNIMHNEENIYGLHVHNQKGQHWVAYGDQSYFSPRSKAHRQHVLKALQKSADELYRTFHTGQLPRTDWVAPLLPFADEEGTAGIRDISPLFYWDETTQQLLRRNDLYNPYDRHWTAQWWGWTTLVQLMANKQLPVLDQAQLATSEWRDAALNSGLITHSDVLTWITQAAE
jgi:hypothetical protein